MSNLLVIGMFGFLVTFLCISSFRETIDLLCRETDLFQTVKC